MKLFDSHCHLVDAAYSEDLDDVLSRMASAGVERAMLVGINTENSLRTANFVEAYPNLFSSVGVHPHDAGKCSEEDLAFLQELSLNNSSIRAWGEIGLDFNRNYSPRADQEKWFERQLECADQLKLPRIFHERDSGGRFLEMLKAHYTDGVDGVVHCFSGNARELESYIDLGLHIGITGIITLKERGEPLRGMVHAIPEDRLLVETDAPYLTPTPERKKQRRNEPAFVRTAFLKLAEVRGDDPDRLAKTIWDNTCRLFGIDDV